MSQFVALVNLLPKQLPYMEMLQHIEHHKQQCDESLEKAVLCWRWCLFLLQLCSKGLCARWITASRESIITNGCNSVFNHNSFSQWSNFVPRHSVSIKIRHFAFPLQREFSCCVTKFPWNLSDGTGFPLWTPNKTASSNQTNTGRNQHCVETATWNECVISYRGDSICNSSDDVAGQLIKWFRTYITKEVHHCTFLIKRKDFAFSVKMTNWLFQSSQIWHGCVPQTQRSLITVMSFALLVDFNMSNHWVVKCQQMIHSRW